jgi:asparagine synthase (glutamine-hydrolysing)
MQAYKKDAVTGKIKVNLDNLWYKAEAGQYDLYLKSSKFSSDVIESLGLGERIAQLPGMDESSGKLTDTLGSSDLAHISLVAVSSERVILKSDIARTAPLFYRLNDGEITVTDHLSLKSELEVDPDAVEELIATGYVSGSKTIFKEYSGIRPGEIVSINCSPERHRYFYNKTHDDAKKAEPEDLDRLASGFDSILFEVISEITDALPRGRRVVVPLSGGHDSRLIVNHLYKVGFRDVLCYTYGLPENKQSRTSREVAEALGFEWHFVEYSEEKWKKLHESGDIERYINFASRGVSTPHLQDFLAVYELREKGILRDDDVVMPGHGLDILCQVIDVRNYADNLVEGTVQRFEQRKNFKRKYGTALFHRYREHRESFPFGDEHFIDYMFWQENQVKYLVNSIRVYEYFGLNWCIAYWDRRITDFWYSIAMESKFDRNLLRELEKRGLIHEKLLGVPYCDERIVNRGEKRKVPLRQKLAKWIPNRVTVALLKIMKTKPQLDEGMNLIYAKKIQKVSDIAGNRKKWPKRAANYFRLEQGRLPWQANHELLVRMHTLAIALSKQR